MITRTESRISIIYLEHEAEKAVLSVEAHQSKGYRVASSHTAKNGEQGFYILKREDKTGDSQGPKLN